MAAQKLSEQNKLSFSHVMAETVPYLTLVSPPFQPHAAPHFMRTDLFFVYLDVPKKRDNYFLFFLFHILQYRTLKETNRIL